MGVLFIDSKKCDLCGICTKVCPFGGIDINRGRVEINAACKMCKVCIKKCPNMAISMIDQEKQQVDKSGWKGILVFVEHSEGEINPVTMELLGKAIELGEKVAHPVYCIFMGSDISSKAEQLLNYGVNRVFVYDYEELRNYRADIYTNVFEHCINKIRPSVVLIGATSIGRSLAPRVAVRFRTGLTADCTMLDIRQNTDLVQIRPAFGGNIMAQIVTPYTRPQFATVRYKVMNPARRIDSPASTVERCFMDESLLKSGIKVLEVRFKNKQSGITDTEVLVAAGRGIKYKKDLAMLEDMAYLLNGQLAATRPLVEAGWVHYTHQIGLSGRTVKPRLIITCGISGAVQFTAGMNSSECIIAIDRDKDAPIFRTAHYGMVGDLYDIVPMLIEGIKGEKTKCSIKN